MNSFSFSDLKAIFRRKEQQPVVEFPDDINPDDVVWHGVNAGAWKKVSGLNIHTNSKYIYYQQDATAKWTPVLTGYKYNPETKKDEPVYLVGNAWVLVRFAGVYHAATNEFFRPGQTEKGKDSVTSENDHIHAAPFRGWKPVRGERIGFMCSTFARDRWKNGQERTKITEFVWS